MGASSVNDEISISDIKKVDSSTFFNALKRAKRKNPHGAYVTLHATEDYDKCKGMFLLKDESAGIAVEQDGNIISVFSDQTHRGVLKSLIAVAVQEGGIKLDCFGSEKLRALYLLRGFIPVSRTKFVRKFAPEDWNYEQDGEPDIFFWMYIGDNESARIEGVFDRKSVPEFSSYREASRYRDKLILFYKYCMK